MKVTERAANALRDMALAQAPDTAGTMRLIAAEPDKFALRVDAPAPDDELIERQHVPLLAVEQRAAVRLSDAVLDYGRDDSSGELTFHLIRQ
jgi:Fe-S cluster assembly iron-binding protein IscA